MKRIRHIAGISTLLFTLTATAIYGQDTLHNPGFEEGLTSWRTGVKDPDVATAAPHAAQSGALGLEIQSPDDKGSMSLVSDPVQCEAGQAYQVNFWARTLSGSGASVYLRFYDANGKLLSSQEERNHVLRVIPGDQKEWGYFSLAGIAPDRSVNIRVAVHLFGGLKVIAHFDDFELSTTSEEAVNEHGSDMKQ